MKVWKPLMFRKRRRIGGGAVLILLAAAAAVAALAQVASTPIKQGLWETTATSTNVMSMPPDVEARIAAMPADQQAMVRSRMGGAPVSSTNKSCVATQETMNSLMDQAQQKPGMKCTFSNRKETASSVSFDISCTTPEGVVTGHSEFQMADSEHGAGTTHVEGQFAERWNDDDEDRYQGSVKVPGVRLRRCETPNELITMGG
jgi:hypothetical protein